MALSLGMMSGHAQGYPGGGGYPGSGDPTPTPSGGYPGGGGYPGSRGHWVVTYAYDGHDQVDAQTPTSWNSTYDYRGISGVYKATTSCTVTATCTWTHDTGQDDTSDPAPTTLYAQESVGAIASGDYTTYDNQGQGTQHVATLAVDDGSGDPITLSSNGNGVPDAEQEMTGIHYQAVANSAHADVVTLPVHSLSASATWNYDSTASGSVGVGTKYGVVPITVSILWNGQDVTDKTQNVKVGQRIGLSGSVTGADGLTLTNPHWVIPGIRVRDWTYSDTSSLEWPIGDSQLNSPSINYGWVDGGNARQVTFTITVAGLNCQATTTFNVERPSYTFTVTPTGTIALDPDGSGGARIHYGNPSTATPPGTPGATFSTNPTLPSPNYNLKIAQLLSTQRSITSGNAMRSWTPTSGLDAFPSVANDSPDDALNASDNSISINDSFQAWLMYRPSESDMFVPLSVLSWRWSATATRQGTTWVSSDLGATSTTPTTTTNATDTTAYPQWNQKASPPQGHYQ